MGSDEEYAARTRSDESMADRLMRLAHGPNPHAAVKKVAEKAGGETVVISADEWLSALRQLEGVAVEFQLIDGVSRSYLWHDGDAYRAAEMIPGLEDREDRPLNRTEAGALLDGSVLALAEPVPVSEVAGNA